MAVSCTHFGSDSELTDIHSFIQGFEPLPEAKDLPLLEGGGRQGLYAIITQDSLLSSSGVASAGTWDPVKLCVLKVGISCEDGFNWIPAFTDYSSGISSTSAIHSGRAGMTKEELSIGYWHSRVSLKT